ncbi:transposase [Geothrix sp. PMB-07]|uniref:transposase n=1 Tax=Geothrix sp. PMB-07 TaxID=3068640 RepID=UPI003557FDEA
MGDAHGNPVDFVLTPGQSHESKQLGSLLMGREAGAVLGDRAYDGKSCWDQIASIGAEAVVPPHPCRKDPAAFDKHFYKARHAVENLFAKLNNTEASLPVTTKPCATTAPWSPLPVSLPGSDFENTP